MSDTMIEVLRIIVMVIAIEAARRWARKHPFRFWEKWIARTKPKQAHVLYYPSGYVVLILFAAFGYLAIFALVVYTRTLGNPTATWGVMAFFGGAAVLSFLAIIPYFTDRHYLTEEGILHSRWMGLRGKEFIPWSEVRRVSFSRFWRAFVLHTDRRKAYISTAMLGLPEFADLVFRHVPPSAIDKAARVALLALGGKVSNEELGELLETLPQKGGEL